MSTRRHVTWVALLLVFGGAAVAVHADEGASPGALRVGEEGLGFDGKVREDAERAIATGLARLLELQDRQTGAFGTQYKVASTSLAGLALLAAGEPFVPGGPLDKAREAILFHAARFRDRPDHVFIRDTEEQGRMHSHGFATLFLSELYGHVSDRDRLREMAEVIRGAVRLSLDAQTELGGWGYYARGDSRWGEDEASVTITQIQALRAARNAGFAVPSGAVDRAIAYVKRSMKLDGSCRYSLTMGGAESDRSSFELTAAAVATLNAAGVYASAELERGLAYLRKSLREPDVIDRPTRAASDFFYYGNLYAAQAMYQAGGEDWAAWYPLAVKDLIRSHRTPEGGWECPRNFGEAYATASALLILEIPRHYLPIFER